MKQSTDGGTDQVMHAASPGADQPPMQQCRSYLHFLGSDENSAQTLPILSAESAFF